MTLTFHKVGPDRLDDWSRVVSWVYRRRAPEASEIEPAEEGETRYLACSGGTPVGACAVYDYTVAVGVADIKMGGVAAVATLPESRGCGVADGLMKFVLEQMHQDGYDLSMLYPFRESYYRKFEYETCGWRYQVKCPAHRLPKVSSGLPVRQVLPDSLMELNPVYERFIRQRSGSPLRDESAWRHRMGKTAPMIYAIGEPVEAYAWFHMEEFWGNVEVGECVWSSRAGYEGILALVRSLASNQTTVTWNEPPDSPFLADFLDQGVEVSVKRPTMARAINADRLLAKVADGCQSEIEISDALIPANARKVPSPAVSLTPGKLAQVVLGQPGIAQMAASRSVSADRLSQLSTLFPARPVVCLEFF